MRLKDKISKASLDHFATARDTVLKNVTIAVQNGNVKMESSELPVLLNVIRNSLDEGYNGGHRVFERQVASMISKDLATSDETSQVKLAIVQKKKLIFEVG